MAPTKAKVRKRAGSKRLAPAVTTQDQYQTDDEDVAVTIQDDVSQKLHALVKDMTDLSTKECQRQGEASPISNPSTALSRWRARQQGSPTPDPNVAEEVHRLMAKRMR